MAKQDFIEAGRISNTHGVKGELKVQVWLDSPQFMQSFPRLYIDGVAYALRSCRIYKKEMLLAKLEGVDDLDTAASFKGKIVSVARTDAKLPEGAYFLQDLFGARVENLRGEEVGTLTDVLDRPASLIYVVTRRDHEYLIPAVPEFIKLVDAEEGLIVVDLIEGL